MKLYVTISKSSDISPDDLHDDAVAHNKRLQATIDGHKKARVEASELARKQQDAVHAARLRKQDRSRASTSQA